jgi:hypothetical protein
MKELDTKIFNYSPCFEIIAWRYKSYKSKVYDKVFGVIYRYSQLNSGVCYASVIDTLAPAIGITPKVFGETVKVLIRDGFITLLEEGHTNKYVPNLAKVEQLLEDRKKVEVYVDNTQFINKKKGLPNSLSKEYLPRLQVDNTQTSEEILPQVEVDNTLKETELIRESLRESSDLSEPSEGRTPSSVPPDSVETKVSPSSPGDTDSSFKELVEEFEESLFKKSKFALPKESNLDPVSSDNSSETVLKVEESKLASSDVVTSSESTPLSYRERLNILERMEKAIAIAKDINEKMWLEGNYEFLNQYRNTPGVEFFLMYSNELEKLGY